MESVFGSSIPQVVPVETKILIARRYTELGWPVFVLGVEKRPIRNCPRCDSRRADYAPHDREKCACLTCHGFYAATLDVERVEQMLHQHPVGRLAVRTGAASGLLVIDAEAHADPRAGDDLTGLNVLDDWLGWTGHELAPTLRQRTSGGGLHVVYRIPSGRAVYGHPRVLPQVDVKAEGGYIVVADGSDGRHWVNRVDALIDAPNALCDWLETRERRGVDRLGRSGLGGGWSVVISDDDYRTALEEGAKAGLREPFFARLSFTLRRQGVSETLIAQEMYDHWLRCEQPVHDEFPWAWVQYKIERDRNVRPDRQVPSQLHDWAVRMGSSVASGSGQVGDPYAGRRVTIVRRHA